MTFFCFIFRGKLLVLQNGLTSIVSFPFNGPNFFLICWDLQHGKAIYWKKYVQKYEICHVMRKFGGNCHHGHTIYNFLFGRCCLSNVLYLNSLCFVSPTVFVCCSFHFVLLWSLVQVSVLWFSFFPLMSTLSHTSTLVTPFYFCSIRLTHLAFVFLSCLLCSWRLKWHNSSGQARSSFGHRLCLLCDHLLKTQVGVAQ